MHLIKSSNLKVDIKNVDKNKINSKVDTKKIKIIDFNKLKEREKILKTKLVLKKLK